MTIPFDAETEYDPIRSWISADVDGFRTGEFVCR